MPPVKNRLIQRLPLKQRRIFVDGCETVDLQLADVPQEPGKPARRVYFPTSGFVSLIVETQHRPALEVGMVGNEGMVGAHVALGVLAAPLRAVVQGKGSALSIGVRELQAQMTLLPALQRGLHQYLYVLMAQLATSSACLRFHQIGPRLARWLLMSQDRARSDSFLMTQEFLAYMLGVRRVSITQAAGALQRAGIIRYSRGILIVLDRKKLESAACGCYRIDERAYAEVLT